MENEDIIERSLTNLNETSRKFLTDNCAENDLIMVDLLKGITIVEKETVSAQLLFNQLKENYFQTDLVTAKFINNLYMYDFDTMGNYFDIYLEQVYSSEVDEAGVKKKINDMKVLLEAVDDHLVTLFEQKIEEHSSSLKL